MINIQRTANILFRANDDLLDAASRTAATGAVTGAVTGFITGNSLGILGSALVMSSGLFAFSAAGHLVNQKIGPVAALAAGVVSLFIGVMAASSLPVFSASLSAGTAAVFMLRNMGSAAAAVATTVSLFIALNMDL
ncbi:hypothetical protein N9Y92_02330 [Chlamydiales bacterium]|nr:hypothetical protein [Chlamydiales bacterium]